jgi:hypothetical protein
MNRHAHTADITVHKLKINMKDSVKMHNNLEKKKKGNKKTKTKEK